MMPSDSVAFDRAAGYYDETRGFPPGESGAVGALIARAGKLGPNSHVVEIGIGTGRIALPLAPHVGGVFGVDLARPMLARLREKQQDERVHVVEGDSVWLPYAAGAFDAAVAVHVFHLIPAWQTALREVARVLRPGGVLLSGFRQGHHEHPVEQALWGAWNAVTAGQTTRVGITRDQYGTFLADQGWVPNGAPLIHTYVTTVTPSGFIDRLENRVWSGLWHMRDDEVAAGVEAVRAAVRDLGVGLDDPVEVPTSFSVQAFSPPEYPPAPSDSV